MNYLDQDDAFIAGVGLHLVGVCRHVRSARACIPAAASVRVIASPYGHDGFLIETAQVADCLAELIPAPAPAANRQNHDPARPGARRGVSTWPRCGGLAIGETTSDVLIP